MSAAHVYQIFIRATPEQVWTAITDPEWTRRYFFGTAFESPLSAGQPYRSRLPDGQPAVEGTVEVLEPPHRLVQTWRVLYDAAMSEERPSRVEWQIDSVGEQLTRIRLVHRDLALSPLTWATVGDGWPWVLDSMKSLIETGEGLPPVVASGGGERGAQQRADEIHGDWHRSQGVQTNNAIWDLLDQPASAERDEELVRTAYASAYHWARAARRGPENDARAAYMIAKVQLAVGEPALSLQAADRTLAICEQHGLADFDLAYAHEARSRALEALGRADDADAAWKDAIAVPIADPDDRAILEGDLAVPLR